MLSEQLEAVRLLRNAKGRAWKKANADKVRESNRRYKAAHLEQIKAWNKKSRQKHPETSRRAVRKYAVKYPDKVKALYQKFIENNPGYHAKHTRKRQAANPFYFMLAAARARALKIGVPFNLTAQDIELPEKCPVLGIDMYVAMGAKDKTSSPSLDRIIPALGYIPENVRVISWRANALKNNGTAEELMAVALYVQRETVRVKQELGLP